MLCRDWGLAHLSPSFQVMALGMQVLILNCGVQQILAGEVTRGGLLSFLLYQEEVGHHVRVSGARSRRCSVFQSGLLGHELYLFNNNNNKKHPLKQTNKYNKNHHQQQKPS